MVTQISIRFGTTELPIAIPNMKLYKLNNYTVMLGDDEEAPKDASDVFDVDDITASWINKGAAPIIEGKTVSVDVEEITEMVKAAEQSAEKAEARRKERADSYFLNTYFGEKEMAKLAEDAKPAEIKSLDQLLIIK